MSTTVAEHGGNWLGSRMARLAGAFAGIVLVDVPADHVSDLSTALDELASQGVRITITSTDEASEPDQLVLKVRLTGHDRPGIVRQVTSTFADLGVTIDDMQTSLRDAPMGDGVLFEAEVLREFCKGRIAHYKTPRHIKFVDDFPMTISGKVQKFRMREISVVELGISEQH